MIRLVVAINLALIVAGVCISANRAAAFPKALDIRIGLHSYKTRLVVDLSEKADFRLFTLADPYRVVVDLPQIKWEVSPEVSRRSGGLISGFRFGNFRQGQSRIVIDLVKPAKVVGSFILKSAPKQPDRLVLDLEPVERNFFIASLIPPKPLTNLPSIPLDTVKRKKEKSSKFIIVIDPGHGGIDPGAVGVTGVYEKKITLEFSKQLREKLLNLGKFDVRLTREKDVFIPLRTRVVFARRVKADLFLSVHADSVNNRNVRGAGVYTLSENASDKEAAALAAKENRSDVIAGMNLNRHDDQVASILLDLAQRETMNYSARFANAIIPALSGNVRLRSKPHRFAGFRVLKAPDVPSVLLELGYISNRKDEKLLVSYRKRSIIASSLANAINLYFSKPE